jgi:DNA-binding FrmR family transcriptional regulator
MGDHLQHCVADALSKGGEDASQKIKEAQQAIERLVKS